MEIVYDENMGDFICRAGVIPWSVRSVEPRTDYTLLLRFSDGSLRVYDFAPLLELPVYGALNDIAVFMRAQALHGTVDWGGDIDIAPEELYENGVVLDNCRSGSPD